MTDIEIKKAAMRKAIDNGYKKDYFKKSHKERHNLFKCITYDRYIETYIKVNSEYPYFCNILFDKEFWKALVGDKYIVFPPDKEKGEFYYRGGGWKYHMQIIALEDRRIQYLKQFI